MQLDDIIAYIKYAEAFLFPHLLIILNNRRWNTYLFSDTVFQLCLIDLFQT